MTIGHESFMLPCIIRQAAWIATVLHKRANGHSSYFKIRGLEYHNSVVQFGEIVMMRIPGHKNKFESCWLTGSWLGRSMQSNEHIVATSSGVFLSRTIRRRVAANRWDSEVFKEDCGVPRRPKERVVPEESGDVPASQASPPNPMLAVQQ